MVLKQFQGTHYMHTSKELRLTVTTDMQIDSKGEKLLMKHNLSITVQEFTSFKHLKLYYLCWKNNSKGKINPV